MKIEKRTFLVSGGASGLGLATVHELLKAHAYVSILDRATPSFINECSSDTSQRVMFVKTDIGKVDEIESAVERTAAWAKETGAPLGGVINAAGIAKAELVVNVKGKPHSTSMWDETLAVNLSGTFHLTRLALKHLIHVAPEDGPDGERGVILMVSSTVAYEGQRGEIAYAATKGAIRSMTLPMARDLSRHSIRVVTIAPGPFTTPMTGQFSKKITDGLHSEALLFPRRYGLPSEFASTVKWVLECPYVNGESIKLTGGARVPASL